MKNLLARLEVVAEHMEKTNNRIANVIEQADGPRPVNTAEESKQPYLDSTLSRMENAVSRLELCCGHLEHHANDMENTF